MIGAYVVDACEKQGYAVRALTRTARTYHDNVTYIVGDVTDADAVNHAVEGSTHVIHLAAKKNDEGDSEKVNVDGTRNVLDACKKYQVELLINMSTQSVRLTEKGAYAQTKAEADAIIAKENVPYITLRPSVVYGDLHSGILGSMLRFVSLPITPIIGDGTTPFWPIHAEDLATIVVNLLDINTTNTTFDVGGTDRITMEELLEKLARIKDKKLRKLHLPLWLCNVIAAMPGSPITKSNVLGAKEDITVESNAIYEVAHCTPRSFDDGLTEAVLQEHAERMVTYTASMHTWQPSPDEIDRYRKTCERFSVPLDGKLVTRWKLGALDTVTRIFYPRCVLRQQLHIAAAITECTVASSAWWLPKQRSLIGILLRTIHIGVRLIGKWVLGIIMLFHPSFIKRHAGL